MPDVPTPEECEDEEVNYARIIQDPKSHSKVIKFFQERLNVSSLHNPLILEANKSFLTRNVPKVLLQSKTQDCTMSIKRVRYGTRTG